MHNANDDPDQVDKHRGRQNPKAAEEDKKFGGDDTVDNGVSVRNAEEQLGAS